MTDIREKCIIFGASKAGETAYELLCEKYNVIGFADNNSNKWGMLFQGLEIVAPQKLTQMHNVQVIVASQYYAEIDRQLRRMGIIPRIFARDINGVGDYGLYELQAQPMGITHCKYDAKMSYEVKKDFSKNYDTDNKNTSCAWQLPRCNGRKRVLMFAYIFPPIAGGGVQRTLKFVKYLRRYGYEPIVVTVENDENYIKDATLTDEIEKDVIVIRINRGAALPEMISDKEWQEIWNLYCGIMQSDKWAEEFLEKVNELEAKKILLPDYKICWVNECLKQIEQKINIKDIDIVYTTADPYSDYILGYYIKQKYNIPWIQDYRDPWCTNEFYIENYYIEQKDTIHLQQQMERRLTEAADAIIVAAEPWKEGFVEKYGTPEDKITEITNGYDEEDFKNISEICPHNKKFTICYNGIIYIDRNPTELINIINNLIEEQLVDSDEIQFIFNGMVEPKWQTQMDKVDKYHILKYNGYMAHEDSIKAAMASDLMVIFGAPEEGGRLIYPGKLFEYLRIGRPVLGYSGSGSIIEKVLKETGLGENFDYGDAAGVKDFVARMYNIWKAGANSGTVDKEKIYRYSREYTTGRLAELMDTLLAETED